MKMLAGDIGGTKTHLAIYNIEKNSPPIKIKEEKFVSEDYTSLTIAVGKFLEPEKIQVDIACFGIAGPVREGRSQTTNLPWIIDAKELSEEINIKKVKLINDLEANAYGLQELSPKEFYVLNKGIPGQKGNGALVSAGTGLGEAGLFFDGENFHPFPCEGGHTDFAPRDKKEINLLLYLQKQFGHVSYERVVSGPGLFNLYQFLVDTKRYEKIPSLEEMMKKNMPGKVITDKALKKEHAICEDVLDWFISLYGAEAGNAALKFFALSGVYLGGGIAPKIKEKLKEGGFMKAFTDKGRFSNLMKTIPVKVVLNEQTALLGALHYAQNYMC